MKQTIRCAIYTRKSSEEGLEQDYNSLDAQRDSCEAYIKSQVHEGWKIIHKHYDDGGYSGGSINRPAFQELLNDIKQNKIDIVVVYKVDRLTRSLMDFSKIVEIFDNHNTSFVSVTQHFNTTTSMGRLTLNILLSFAQFEREVTGERIRDKFVASAKKGLWVTGATPLGYKKENGILVEDLDNSWKIKTIFDKYCEFKSVSKLKYYLDDTKIHTRSNKRFSKGNLYHILSNKVYIGKITKGANVYNGLHKEFIREDHFNFVQKILQNNSPCDFNIIQKNSTNAMLQGKLFDEFGHYFSPSRSTGRSGQIYKYYINQSYKQNKEGNKNVLRRISADKIEEFVLEKINEFLKNKNNLYELIKEKTLLEQSEIYSKLDKITIENDIARECIQKIVVFQNSIEINLFKAKILEIITLEKVDNYNDIIHLEYDVNISTCSIKGSSLIVGKGQNYNQNLVDAVVKGFYYNQKIIEGNFSAELNNRNARRLRKLRFLPPDLIQKILSGEQDANLTIEKLCNIC